MRLVDREPAMRTDSPVRSHAGLAGEDQFAAAAAAKYFPARRLVRGVAVACRQLGRFVITIVADHGEYHTRCGCGAAGENCSERPLGAFSLPFASLMTGRLRRWCVPFSSLWGCGSLGRTKRNPTPSRDVGCTARRLSGTNLSATDLRQELLGQGKPFPTVSAALGTDPFGRHPSGTEAAIMAGDKYPLGCGQTGRDTKVACVMAYRTFSGRTPDACTRRLLLRNVPWSGGHDLLLSNEDVM